MPVPSAPRTTTHAASDVDASEEGFGEFNEGDEEVLTLLSPLLTFLHTFFLSFFLFLLYLFISLFSNPLYLRRMRKVPCLWSVWGSAKEHSDGLQAEAWIKR